MMLMTNCILLVIFVDSNVQWMDKELLFLIAKRDIAHSIARNAIDKETCKFWDFYNSVIKAKKYRSSEFIEYKDERL